MRRLVDTREVAPRHLRHLGDVLACVAALGRRLTVQPRVDRLSEHARLRVLVVDVVLALGLVARELEEPGQRVAEDGPAPVTDVQGPGRVHAEELDLEPLGVTQVG